MKHNKEIDRLRSINILMLIVCHLYLFFFPGVSLPLFGRGFATTIADAYFAISGFVISCVLVKRMDQLKKDNKSLIAFIKGFYIKRTLSIFPSLVTVLIGVFMCGCYFNVEGGIAPPIHILHAGLMVLTATFNYYFIGNYFSLALAPLWTLAIEMQFYLVFPIFILMTKNNKQRAWILIAMLACVIGALRPLTLYYYPFVGLFFTQTRCDAIIYGILVYILSQQPWFEHLKPTFINNPWIGTGLVTVFVCAIIAVTLLRCSPAVYLSLGSVLAAMLVIAASFERNVIAFPSLIQYGLDVLAPRSYSLYITHFPVIIIVNEIFHAYGLTRIHFIAITVILIFVCSEIIYQFLHAPFLEKGRVIADKLNQDEANKTMELASSERSS